MPPIMIGGKSLKKDKRMVDKMTPIFTLLFIVCIAAILALFREEIGKKIKLLLSVPGATLVVPLVVGSLVTIHSEQIILWFLYYIHGELLRVQNVLEYIIPFHDVALVVMLSIISIGPVVFLNWKSFKENHLAYKYPYTTSTLLLIVAWMLMVL